MLCPHCNQEHPANSRFCPTTGSPLPWTLPTCPNCSRELRPGARYCASCGATLPREIHRQAIETHGLIASPAPEGAAPLQQNPAGETESPALETEPTPPPQASSHLQPAPNGAGSAPAWVAVPTSPRSGQEWERRQTMSRTRAYLLGGLLLAALVVGLGYLWLRFTAAQADASAQATSLALFAAGQTETAVRAAAEKTELAIPTLPLPSATIASPEPSSTPLQTAVAILPTATSGPTPTPPGYSPYRLAFYSNRDNQSGIYLMDPDHPDDWIVLPAPEEYELFAWPTFCDGRLAFEAGDRSLNLPSWIYFYDLARRELAPLALAGFMPDRAIQPGCSPDGRYLAFTAFQSGRWSLALYDFEQEKILVERRAGEYSNLGFASFLTGANLYLWMGVRASGYYDINQTDLSTGANRQIAEGKYPVIAPDGSRLVYFCGNLLHLCMIERETNELLFQIPVSYFKKINKKAVPATAAWSGDGEWVYFSSSILGNWDVYRMHPDGSQMQNLTESWTSDEYMPAAR